MGTETRFNASIRNYRKQRVKLNNPQMGTETVVPCKSFQQPFLD